jgi:hypothetical protein
VNFHFLSTSAPHLQAAPSTGYFMTQLYAVFGGHLPDPSTSGPKDIVEPELISLHLDPAAARSAWNGASYATVDDAHQRYFEVCLHMDVEPKDVTPLEKHVMEMIFTIGTETQLLQLITAKMNASADLEPAEARLVEEVFASGRKASPSRWAAAMADPDSDTFWMTRVYALIQSALAPLVYLRDHEGLRLTPVVVVENMSLKSLASLVPPEGNPVVPAALLESLSRYFDQLPGFRDAADADYSQHTRDHHGYSEMQITRPLLHLSYAGVGAETI